MSSLEAVLAPVAPLAWTDRFAQRTAGVTSSAIRELLKLTERPDIISFAGGLPAPEAFPLVAVEAACRQVLEGHGAEALQYGATEGYLPLRQLLVRHMVRYGIEATPDNVLITSGSQQALDLVGKLLINPGDHVATEQPTYLGALQAFRAYQAQYLPVSVDGDGMDVTRLEQALRGGPKFLYALPNFQNPSGVTLSLARRQRVVELAAHYGVPIVEDDPYGQLRYEGEHLPPLVKLDAERRGGATDGGVIYLGTLSKILGPGLRIGWVVAPADVIRKLVQLKQGADLHTSTFAQMVAYETARGGFLDAHVRHVRKVYGRRRDIMLRALEAHFPPQVRWTRPQGGLFLWVTLPPELDSACLLGRALEQKVAFV
ncbi:MAG TPA: PLP-dependent aminotransferase family protein, partial [Vicinamibacteria bacterium]